MVPGPAEDATLLSFKKGDLLILTKKQELLASESWTLGQNDRTGKTGLMPTNCLYIIPTLTKPSAQLLVPPMLLRSLNPWAPRGQADGEASCSPADGRWEPGKLSQPLKCSGGRVVDC